MLYWMVTCSYIQKRVEEFQPRRKSQEFGIKLTSNTELMFGKCWVLGLDFQCGNRLWRAVKTSHSGQDFIVDVVKSQ